jgi:tetratricopeptide (TPR) repeat protein
MNNFTGKLSRGLTPVLLLVLTLLPAGCRQESKMVNPKEKIAEGWDYYRVGEFYSAVKAFETVAKDPKVKQADQLEALYGLATTWNLRRPGQDPVKAQHYYRQVLKIDPKSDLAAWSLLALARMQHLVPVGEEPDYKKVKQAYQEVIDQFPNHLAADEALIYQQSILVSTFEKEDTFQAVRTLEKFIQTHPNSYYLSSAYSLLATCFNTLHMPEKKLQAMIKQLETLKIDPTNPFNDNAAAIWLIATVAEFEAGDFPTAKTYYLRMLKEYPTDVRKYAAREAIKRMDLLEESLRNKKKT